MVHMIVLPCFTHIWWKSCRNLKYVLCIWFHLKNDEKWRISSPNGIFLEGKWWFTSGLRATWLYRHPHYFTFTGFISCRISWKWHAKWQSRILLWAGLESLFAKKSWCLYIYIHNIYFISIIMYIGLQNINVVNICSIFSSLRQPICSTSQDSTWKLERF